MDASTYQFDHLGKLAGLASAELTSIDATTSIIAYSSGIAGSGRPYYAYIAVKPSKYREFYEFSAARKPLTLNDYGTVIASGFEARPPASVVAMMRKKYGFDEQYEAAVKAEVSRQRGEFSMKQEEKRLMDIVAMIKASKH